MPLHAGFPNDQPQGPLQGLVVLDLTRVLAGPYATMVLRDMGARVIKIERPGVGDDARRFPPFLERSGESAYFITVNRGKESVALDFSGAEGRVLLLSLCEHADVVVENFTPGLLERYGLGPDVLLERNPRLIVARLSGYGQDGPDRDLPAYDITIQARSGLMSLTGSEDGVPVKIGSAVADIGGGVFCALAILAALLERASSGRGQVVDMAMLDASVALLENSIVRRTVGGLNPRPIGQRHPSITPFDGFACSDGTVVIAAGNDDIFGRIARALGRPQWLSDPRFAGNEPRTEHHQALKNEMEAVTRTRPVEHWLRVFRDAQVPAARIQSIDDVLHDPQVRARGMITSYAPDGGAPPFDIVGSPLGRFSRTPAVPGSHASRLGEDTEAVLTSLLGLAPEVLARLRDHRAIP